MCLIIYAENSGLSEDELQEQYDERKDEPEFFQEIVLNNLIVQFGNVPCVIISNAHPIIQDLDSKGNTHWMFTEFMIDLSHLSGHRKEDLEILIVPMENVETAANLCDRIAPMCKKHMDKGLELGVWDGVFLINHGQTT